MANQKQRRRRDKEMRHEYEIVEIDGEGNEIVLSGSGTRSSDGRPSKSGKQSVSRPKRRGRFGEPQPPSWQRVAKRMALFGPLFVVLIMVTGGKEVSILDALINGMFLTAVMAPLMYLMDKFMWRQWEKRQGGTASRQRRK